MGMALLSVQLLELVLADFPTDTQARRVRPPTRGCDVQLKERRKAAPVEPGKGEMRTKACPHAIGPVLAAGGALSSAVGSR